MHLISTGDNAIPARHCKATLFNSALVSHSCNITNTEQLCLATGTETQSFQRHVNDNRADVVQLFDSSQLAFGPFYFWQIERKRGQIVWEGRPGRCMPTALTLLAAIVEL